MRRFMTALLMAGMLSGSAFAGELDRPSGSDTTTVASKVSKPSAGAKKKSGKKGKKSNAEAQRVAADVISLLEAFGFQSPAISALIDGLDVTDLNALLRDLTDGNLAGLDLGGIGDLFQLDGNGSQAKAKGGKAKSKAKAGSSTKQEMLAMKGL